MEQASNLQSVESSIQPPSIVRKQTSRISWRQSIVLPMAVYSLTACACRSFTPVRSRIRRLAHITQSSYSAAQPSAPSLSIPLLISCQESASRQQRSATSFHSTRLFATTTLSSSPLQADATLPTTTTTSLAQDLTDVRNNPHLRCISYITDIEGDKSYLERFVQQSHVLEWTPRTPDASFPYDACIDFSHSTSVLVMGGDAIDQGGSDLYVLRQLLDLKARYPDRVYWVVGNRDVNKLRLTSEWLWKDAFGDEPSFVMPTRYEISKSVDKSNPVDYLKTILAFTMGSPRAFEHRRSELQLYQDEPVTDIDVVKSYLDFAHPTRGELGRYLRQGYLCLKIGSAFFVHGALPLTDEIMSRHGDNPQSLWDDWAWALPWGSERPKKSKISFQDWLEHGRAFYQDQLQKWINHVHELEMSADDTTTIDPLDVPFLPLIQYGRGRLPDSRGNPTIVYNSWNTNGMPERFYDTNSSWYKAVESFFESTHTSHIVCGHQPQGDLPTTIRINKTNWIISADTSYSGHVDWPESDLEAVKPTTSNGRGPVAVTEILLIQDARTGQIVSTYMHGTLSPGQKYESVNLDARVGKAAVKPDILDSPSGAPWWTRVITRDGEAIVSTCKGYNVWNCIVPANVAEETCAEIQTELEKSDKAIAGVE
jgi:Calcineurin-like phosphoesterase